MAQEKRQTFRVEEKCRGQAAYINALHLRQILAAIVENAVKYTPAGGCIALCSESGDDVRLSVTDNGIGISPEHLPRIFDRFYRVDTARTDISEGVGLGLPIAKSLASLYGGTIEVSSLVGAGSTFSLRLPTLREEPRP